MPPAPAMLLSATDQSCLRLCIPRAQIRAFDAAPRLKGEADVAHAHNHQQHCHGRQWHTSGTPPGDLRLPSEGECPDHSSGAQAHAHPSLTSPLPLPAATFGSWHSSLTPWNQLGSSNHLCLRLALGKEQPQRGRLSLNPLSLNGVPCSSRCSSSAQSREVRSGDSCSPARLPQS